jgi:hypothetical protein
MTTPNKNYQEAKNAAKIFYLSIGPIWCPALDEYVHFNHKGFQHLMSKRGSLRPEGEQMRRFNLLRYVSPILGDPGALLMCHQKKQGRVKVNLWVFSKILDNVSIKVVIRQIGKGNKHFLSIYGKNQKSAQ